MELTLLIPVGFTENIKWPKEYMPYIMSHEKGC